MSLKSKVLGLIPAAVVAGLCTMVLVGQEMSAAEYRTKKTEPVTITTAETTSDYFAYLDAETTETVEGKEISTATAKAPQTRTEARRALCNEPVTVRKIPDDEKYLLAKIAMAEAEGESLKGKALVVMVVLNRVDSPDYPDTVEGVIFEEKQFSPIDDGRWDAVEPDRSCLEAVELVCEGWDESEGATCFATSEAAQYWHHDALEYLFTEGAHDFFREK